MGGHFLLVCSASDQKKNSFKAMCKEFKKLYIYIYYIILFFKNLNLES